jgi:FMN reductase
MTQKRPMILGLGGTLRDGSSSERALSLALQAAQRAGAEIKAVTGSMLNLPHYDPGNREGAEAASALIDLYRRCDGVIISSPGYHGSISGMIKNALDYIEELSKDDRVYLEDRPVGCIVCAYGWQATGTTLVAMRSVVHALRGWPTPLGVTINSAQVSFDDAGQCSDSRVSAQLEALAGQVMSFARRASATPVPVGVAA